MDDAALGTQTASLTVVRPIACIECSRPWVVAAERWRLKILDEVDFVETVPYCPDCFAREFGA